VLGGILDNDTALAIREHASDTHGFTEHLFGLCALLGIAFVPITARCSRCSAVMNASATLSRRSAIAAGSAPSSVSWSSSRSG